MPCAGIARSFPSRASRGSICVTTRCGRTPVVENLEGGGLMGVAGLFVLYVGLWRLWSGPRNFAARRLNGRRSINNPLSTFYVSSYNLFKMSSTTSSVFALPPISGDKNLPSSKFPSTAA